MLVLQFLDALDALDNRLAEGENLHVWLVIRDRAQFESAAGIFLKLLLEARSKMVSVRIKKTGIPILDLFAAKLSGRINEDWAKWQLCRYAEIAIELMCCGISRATRPPTTPEVLFEEGRAPTFGSYRDEAQRLAAQSAIDSDAWGIRFFAHVLQDEQSASALAIVIEQRNHFSPWSRKPTAS